MRAGVLAEEGLLKIRVEDPHFEVNVRPLFWLPDVGSGSVCPDCGGRAVLISVNSRRAYYSCAYSSGGCGLCFERLIRHGLDGGFFNRG